MESPNTQEWSTPQRGVGYDDDVKCEDTNVDNYDDNYDDYNRGRHIARNTQSSRTTPSTTQTGATAPYTATTAPYTATTASAAQVAAQQLCSLRAMGDAAGIILESPLMSIQEVVVDAKYVYIS